MPSNQGAHRDHAEFHGVMDNCEYFCGSCCWGTDDLQALQDHQNDEEHMYHIQRRHDLLCPGIGFCVACSCVIQTKKNWETHVLSEKHKKCYESGIAAGRTLNMSDLHGCTEVGKLGGLVGADSVDVKKAALKGYGKPSNINGCPVIGLNYVTLINESENMFRCIVCNFDFQFKDRKAHLTGVEHRKKYIRQHHKDKVAASEEFDFNSDKIRYKNRFTFLAYKIQQEELPSETSASKTLRGKFFDLATALRIEERRRKQDAALAKRAANNKGRQTNISERDHPRDSRDHGHMMGPAYKRERIEEPHWDRQRGPGPDYDRGIDHRMHDRMPDHRMPDHRMPDHRMPDHRMPDHRPLDRMPENSLNEPTRDDAIQAIDVLERFSLVQAQDEIRERSSRMKEAVNRGIRLSDVPGYEEAIGSLQTATRARSPAIQRAAPARAQSPPRKILLQEDEFDKWGHEQSRAPSGPSASAAATPKYWGHRRM